MAGAFKATLLLNAVVIAAVFLQEVHGMPMLPCNSPLRLSFPTFFTHCTAGVCDYSDWSDWEMVPNSVVDVNNTNCSSGQAYSENRTQTAFGCEDKTETKLICLPPQVERLIIALGLGRTSGGQPGPPGSPGHPGPPQQSRPPRPPGQSRPPRPPGHSGPPRPPGHSGPPGHNRPTTPPIDSTPSTLPSYRPPTIPHHPPSVPNPNPPLHPPSVPNPPPLFRPSVLAPRMKRQARCPVETDGVGQQICHRHTEPRGKRETGADGADSSKGETKVPREAEAHHNAVEFDWHEHGRRFRRQTSCYTDSNDPKYILFLLDKSGSVGRDNFEKMKTALHKLIPLFCGPIRVAVMTFDHEYFLEFCFDCYGSDANGRNYTQTAVMKMVFGDGGWTHTGGAARCACYDVLNVDCGLPDDASCIDVVFITDGISNDPTRDICVEIDCIKSRPGVTTHAIGIGLYDNQRELNCIKHATNAFNYADIDAFLQGIEDVWTKIGEGILFKGYNNSCSNPDASYNPTPQSG